jgi:hypothetical protein
LYAYANVGVAKHADVAEVPTVTVSPAKIVLPGVEPFTCNTVGALTVGAAQVAFTVVFALPLWPLAETTALMAYDFDCEGLNVVGFVVVEANAVDAASTDDQANVYVRENRAGHFAGSESSEKCVPLAGDALKVHESIGLAPVPWVAAAVAVIGFAPHVSAVNVCWPAADAFCSESFATTVAV